MIFYFKNNNGALTISDTPFLDLESNSCTNYIPSSNQNWEKEIILYDFNNFLVPILGTTFIEFDRTKYLEKDINLSGVCLL